MNVVTQLKSVCFTQRRTLFTSKEDSIFKKQANLYGLDLPEKSKIRLDYGATPIGAAKNALRDWKMKRESGESLLFSRNPSVYVKSSAVEYLTQQTEQ